MLKSPRNSKELDKMGVKIEQFKSGAINKPVSIPNTYERLKQHPQGSIKLRVVWLKVP